MNKLKKSARQAELNEIIHALNRNKGNKTKTAKELGIDRKTIYNKLDEAGIDDDFTTETQIVKESIEEVKFYQVRLFSKGEIEIFQNVFHHRVMIHNSEVRGIEIKYSSTQCTGNFTHSFRPYGWYEIQILENPSFDLIHDKSFEGITLRIH